MFSVHSHVCFYFDGFLLGVASKKKEVVMRPPLLGVKAFGLA